MNNLTLVGRYVLFAVIATLVNLATQHLSLATYNDPHFGLPLAMVAGTATGLVVKYVLDKRWIFGDMSTGLATHSRKFGLYTLMGLFTTAIFWGTELTFYAVFQTSHMRDLGAIIGLSIGYVMKYRLDKRFVFDREQLT
ncbi:GtrA family protein [Telmatospirillum sp. J64-1]|uniref:GtrA family protein n=1 Tax=Telmatospirillum sp. J64-1 TaxID=2502183 RepID=UPI00115F0910|nr:GtrA family protein [Telmatospirillum sp. J64-1]